MNLREQATKMPEAPSGRDYARRVQDAYTRNATLERQVREKIMPVESVAIFADFLATYPTVPLKTQTDLGTHYQSFDYAEIVAGFFEKLALDINTSGYLPLIEASDRALAEDLLEKIPTGHFTEAEYRSLLENGINPNIVANLSCAHLLTTYARKEGYQVPSDGPLPARRADFQRDWEDTMSMIPIIQDISRTKTAGSSMPENVRSVATFAQCVRSYPFIPLKISSQTGIDQVPFEFDEMVAQYFKKLSKHVLLGTPVKQLGGAEDERARLLLRKSGLTLELVAHSETALIHNIQQFNGTISPFTVPNLIIAEKLLAESMPMLQGQ